MSGPYRDPLGRKLATGLMIYSLLGAAWCVTWLVVALNGGDATVAVQAPCLVLNLGIAAGAFHLRRRAS